MFEDINLLPEQVELLSRMVEASRSTSEEDRQTFLYEPATRKPSHLSHPGLEGGELTAYGGDLHALRQLGLLARTVTRWRDTYFDVTPRGFRYFEFLQQKAGRGTGQVQSVMLSYLNAEDFRLRHPRAFANWDRAASRLWSSDSAEELTTIGHLCREAVQEFADDLVVEHQPSGVTSDKSKTVARVRAVLDQRQSGLGEAEKPFLDALLAYWGTVSDLIQRQEHGGQREGEPLIWEDARRVVFQTAVVMFEIDRSLRRSR